MGTECDTEKMLEAKRCASNIIANIAKEHPIVEVVTPVRRVPKHPKKEAKQLPSSAAFPHEVNKTNMRKFIGEYLRDFNIVRSVKRMGIEGPEHMLTELANTFFNQPYVQAKLLKKVARLDPGDLVTPSQVVAGLLECANDHIDPRSNSVTRAAAWREIAKILGMYEGETKSNKLLTSPATINLSISNGEKS